MFSSVPLYHRSIDDYRPIVGDEAIDRLRELAEPFRGARILQLNATAVGGGVAELLGGTVPLLRDLGLDADWQVMRGAEEFFTVTKALHNALQGADVRITPEMWDIYRRYSEVNAELWDEDFDIVLIHDPQPAGILHFLRQERGSVPGIWIWRLHVDATDSQPEAWAGLRPFVDEYDAAIFSMEAYVKHDLKVGKLAVIPPSIDPLSPKNYDLPEEKIAEVLRRFNIDGSRPTITQVSRFDPWKDPLGVIDVYRLVRREIPDVQLILVAGMARDDPEGWDYYERTARYAGNDFDIILLSDLKGVGNVEVNALQRSATVLMQKSLREGFGLTVTEGLWKRKAVVGGNVGGIPAQIIHGETGFLCDSIEQAAEQVLTLLRDPALRERLGRRGHEHVRKNFVSTVEIARLLELFGDLRAAASPSDESGQRAPSVPGPT